MILVYKVTIFCKFTENSFPKISEQAPLNSFVRIIKKRQKGSCYQYLWCRIFGILPPSKESHKEIEVYFSLKSWVAVKNNIVTNVFSEMIIM